LSLKKFILVILFTRSFYFCYSQNYESLFGTESTQWAMTIGNLWGTSITEHNITGDSIIEDQSYKAIDGYYDFDEFIGFIRQDESHQKAWYRNGFMDDEILIMDLGLNVGDSMYIQAASLSNHAYYTVDSVYTKNNRKHIQFDLPLYFLDNQKFTLIEGVVSNMGFRYQDLDYSNPFPTILLCAFKNEEKIFGDGDCTISSTEDPKRRSFINIYPNPVVWWRSYSSFDIYKVVKHS